MSFSECGLISIQKVALNRFRLGERAPEWTQPAVTSGDDRYSSGEDRRESVGTLDCAFNEQLIRS